jgi:hypothetical protein
MVNPRVSRFTTLDVMMHANPFSLKYAYRDANHASRFFIRGTPSRAPRSPRSSRRKRAASEAPVLARGERGASNASSSSRSSSMLGSFAYSYSSASLAGWRSALRLAMRRARHPERATTRTRTRFENRSSATRETRGRRLHPPREAPSERGARATRGARRRRATRRVTRVATARGGVPPREISDANLRGYPRGSPRFPGSFRDSRQSFHIANVSLPRGRARRTSREPRNRPSFEQTVKRGSGTVA